MFEAHLPVSGRVNDPHSLDRIGWGHRAGQFWGLAVHPLRDEVSGGVVGIGMGRGGEMGE